MTRKVCLKSRKYPENDNDCLQFSRWRNVDHNTADVRSEGKLFLPRNVRQQPGILSYFYKLVVFHLVLISIYDNAVAVLSVIKRILYTAVNVHAVYSAAPMTCMHGLLHN